MADRTNARLRDLDKRLQAIYNAAYKTAVKNQAKAIEKLASLDVAALRAQGLDDTAIRSKQLAFKAQVERATKIVDNIASDIARAGETAAKIIKGEQLNIYQAGYTGALYSIDEQLGFGLDWTIYDRNQLTALLADENIQPFTKIAYKNLGNDKIIVRRLQNELTQAVLNGEGVPAISRRIRGVTGQSLSQARRVARTETLRVANQGRMLGYHQAADDYNIPMQKQWIATLDSRTRDTHAHMHMELAELDEPFSNGLKQPGDPAGGAAEVINCRCSVVSALKGFKGSKAYQELNARIEEERIYQAREAERAENELIKQGKRDTIKLQKIEADYKSSVDGGKLSPMVSFEDYQGAMKLFDEKLVGLKTADGVEIMGYSKHFIERYFGSVEDRRSGVPLDKIIEALTTDKNPIISPAKKSRLYTTSGAQVSLNPTTRHLIQTQPHRRSKVE